MKKKVIIGALALCLVLGSSIAAYAAERPAFSLPDGFGEIPEINFDLPEGLGGDFGAFRAEMENHRETMKAKMEAHRAEMEEKLAEMKEKATDMSAYEQYGLAYDEAKGGWCYDGKLVGLFVDKQGRGITFLNQDGEVHIKAIRDGSGNLTGLAELSADEYAAIISEMDAMRADMQEQMSEMRRNMEESKSEMEQRMNTLRGSMDKIGN